MKAILYFLLFASTLSTAWTSNFCERYASGFDHSNRKALSAYMNLAITEIRNLIKDLTTTSGKSKRNTKQKKDNEKFKTFLEKFQNKVSPLHQNGPMNLDQQKDYCSEAREVRAYLFNDCTRTSEFKNICTTYGLKIDLIGSSITSEDSQPVVQKKGKKDKKKKQDAYAQYLLNMVNQPTEEKPKKTNEDTIKTEIQGGLLRNGKKYLKDQEILDDQEEESSSQSEEKVPEKEIVSGVLRNGKIFKKLVQDQIDKQVSFNSKVEEIPNKFEEKELKDDLIDENPKKDTLVPEIKEPESVRPKKVKRIIILEVTACENCKEDNVLMQYFADKN